MKKILLPIILLILLVGASGVGGWHFFLRKLPEGNACKSDSRCESGLKCISQVCSSGQAGSVCSQKTDCKTEFCVNGKCTEGEKGNACSQKTDCKTNLCVNSICTEGKKGDVCVTYRDCDKTLLCQKGTCTARPDYTKYFTKIVVYKMKPGSPPGPNNPEIPTTRFTKEDGIGVDFIGVKSTTVGSYYFEIVDSTTGEVGNSTKMMNTRFNGQDTGSGTDLQMLEPGTYDLNVYFKEKLIYTVQITVK
jgi:hypothetical protein